MQAAVRPTKIYESSAYDNINPVTKETLSYWKDGASLCRVTGNIWIGDLGAAAMVAIRRLTGFSAVFNASASESWGVTFSEIYSRLEIAYDTITDYDSGFALNDELFSKTPRDVAETLYKNGDTEPRSKMSVSRDNNHLAEVAIYHTPIVTETMFLWYMHQAARKIAWLVEANKTKDVLVHCVAGMNRSAASIVAYMILYGGETPEIAIETVQEATKAKRRTPSLANPDFQKALKTLSLRIPEVMQRNYEREIMEIKDMARELYATRHAIRRPMLGNSPTNKLTEEEVMVGAPMEEECTDDSSSFVGSCKRCCRPLRRRLCCARCGPLAMYCSRDCQLSDYPRHVKEDDCRRF